MDENAARQALLARAFDSAPPSPPWDEDDRAWARQATARRVGENASLERFVVNRAALVAERLAVRDRSIAQLMRSLAWRPWIGWLVIGLAFAAGLLTDALGAGARVNVLAPPLLATLAWNLGIFALLLARATGLASGGPAGAGAALGPAIERLAMKSRAARLGGSRIARFLGDWTHASAPINRARAAQVLHFAAAAFAAGLLAGLYLRGLALEYRAGWESTFLDAQTVRALLGVVLGPASALTGIALPDATQLAAIRFTEGPGENAARWIHLHATTIGMFVIVPRLALALVARWRAHRLARDFPLPLDDAYFEGIALRLRGDPIRIPVVPYSYRVPAASIRGLHALLVASLGSDVELEVAAAVSPDDADAHGGEPIVGPVEAVLALFSLTATPEVQTHAEFLATLRLRAPADTALLAIVDETAFRARFGHEPRRLDERRAAWRGALAEANCEPVFAALGAADVTELAPTLRAHLDRGAQRARDPSRIRTADR
jgi:hypothetical protein